MAILSATNSTLSSSNASPESGIYITYLDNDNVSKSIYISKFDNFSISTSSTLTEYPTVTGDIYADHIIKRPITISFSGVFQEGKSDNLFSSEIKSLHDIETLFEDIKNNAYLLNIMRYTNIVNSNTASQINFIQRSNMVITEIRWTENVNTLDYSFNFTEVLLTDVVEESEIEDSSDPYLPDTKQLSTTSFTTALIDESVVGQELIRQLYELNLITDRALDYLAKTSEDILESYLKSAIKGAAAGVATGLAVISTVAGISFAIGSAIPFWGWIAAGIATVGTGIVVFAISFGKSMAKIIKRWSNSIKYNIELIDYDESKPEKSAKSINRLCLLFQNTKTLLEKLNDYIIAYEISVNGNQSSLITIDGVGYELRFYGRDGAPGDEDYSYSCDIYDITTDENPKKVAMCPRFTASLTNEDAFSAYPYFEKNGHYIYFISRCGANATLEQRQDLTNYCVVDSTINFENLTEIFEDMVDAALRGGDD